MPDQRSHDGVANGGTHPAAMRFAFELALRYLSSKKRAFVSVGTVFAILGVALGVGCLVTVMSVTGGFRAQFRDKVLGVNAHVLVLKYTSDFREYRTVMKQMEEVPGVVGVAPFVINPMMVTHGRRTATGVLLKGVDPELMPRVLDLPRHIVSGSLDGLRTADSKPPERKHAGLLDGKKDRAPKKPLLEALREVAQGDGGLVPIGQVTSAASAAAPAPVASADDEGDEDVGPRGGPQGDVEPEGGYGSVLDDDISEALPAGVDPDPCADPEKVKKLPGLVVGVSLKDTLAVELGSCVTVTSPTIGYSYAQGSVRAPVAKQFRVIAVFDAGFDQYDSKLVYSDLYEAQAFGDSGDSVTGVEMKVADIDRAADVGRDIEGRLSNGLYNVVDWEELNHGLFTALRVQQILISVLHALIVVVAAFTVIATLIMIVLEKKREVAVLKAMGAGDRQVFLAFLFQGAIIGVVGAGAGLALGWALCRVVLVQAFPLDPKVYFISHLPVQVRPWEFALTGLFAVAVCLIATVFPALHAGRLRPAEAFREQ